MTSTFRTLGCSGGIGLGLSTTSFLLDNDILIDAGTGVGDLSLDELKQINHIFLTHSHLDHIVGVPLIADAVGASRTEPLLVYGTATTLDALKTHILNDVIWPDFTRIPSQTQPFIRLIPIEINGVSVINNRKIVALPVQHSIPANGFAVTSSAGSTLIFSGDTGPCDAFWQAANAACHLKHLIVETSFNDAEEDLAKISGHFSPRLLVDDLNKLQQSQTQIWISHLKPDGGDSIYEEIANRVNALPRYGHTLPQKLIKGTTLTI